MIGCFDQSYLEGRRNEADKALVGQEAAVTDISWDGGYLVMFVVWTVLLVLSEFGPDYD